MRYRWNDLSDLPGDRKLRRERSIEIRCARAQIYLAIERLGPHMAVAATRQSTRDFVT
jgi:hypothetical protein